MRIKVDILEGSRIALYSLRVNRLRTVLTTAGIGIGVATLLAIIGIIQGLNTSFANQMATIGSSSLYISKFPWVIKGDWWQYRNRKDFTLDQLETIRAQSTYTTGLAPVVWRIADVSLLGDQLSLVSIMGTRAEYLSVTGWELSSGRFLNETDDENRRSVAVVGMDVVDRLFPNSDPLGATIRVDNRPFRVVGVLSRRGKILGDSQDLRVMIPFRTFWGYFGKRRGFSIAVGIARPQDIDIAEDQLVGILRRARNTPPGKPDDFTINRPEQLAATYRQLTGALYGVAIGIGLITLLVGGIGIMNIMLVSVRERTREIGIRRALGARKRTIVLQFLMEAAVVSGIGGLGGTLVGLFGAKLVSEITPLAAVVDPLTVVGGVSFAALVGLLFGIWPAARAANLDPVEALRYE
ncbi:MAG TPA: ABC transporter permease [Myxococcaceae bacterium]|nr:ABC transporter permease [Myxococcaceae bacterium]